MRRIGENARQHAAWALITCLGAGSVAALLLVLTDLSRPHDSVQLQWWMLAVGFLLLTHAALRLRPGLVVLFSAVVLTGWLMLLAITLAVPKRL